MSCKKLYIIFLFLLAYIVRSNHCQKSTESSESTVTKVFRLNDALVRYARLRCLQQFPRAEIVNYTDTPDTHCFLDCFVYKMGLMNLKTRGLNSKIFVDIWEGIEQASEEDNCLERFWFSEELSGRCNDTYRKLMEFRSNCLELFQYIFTTNREWKSPDPGSSKTIGQSATEFCDFIERQDNVGKENSQYNDVSLISLYKDKLKCIFENFHYFDAYGRVDENEVNLSYQEAHADSLQSRAVVHDCVHRANIKYRVDYRGDSAVELQKCLKARSSVFDKVFQIRDETSRQY